MITQEILRELIMTGVRFSYQSYNHKKAVQELEQIDVATNGFRLKYDCWSVPDSYKKKYEVWRTGKVWSVHFNRYGDIDIIYIGKMFKFKKRFYAQDFGVIVKPVLFKSDDKFDLIAKGFAIEDNVAT